MSHQTNNNTTSRKPTEDRVHGFSVVFSLRRPEKQHKYKAKNELKAHTIRQRIMLSSLNKRRIFFVENNNLHSLPPHCTGVLVAYSPCGKRITTEKDITDHHQWFLGTIIFHSYDITSIAPTEVRDEYYDKVSQSWNSANNVEYKILTERAVLLRRHEFKLRYINVVEVEQIPGQHYIEASLHGPDTVPRTVEMKKTMQELRSSNKCFLPEGSLSIPSRYVGKSPLLDILYCYKGGKPNITSRNNVKRRSIAAVGTHIVEIEGPITKLREGVDKSCLLVPLHQSKDIDSVSDSDVQQYVYLPKETYTSLCSGLEQRPDDMNKKLFMSSEKVVNLRKYDLDNYPNGLIFLYRPNDKLSEQTIVKEWDTPTAMEHWQLNGTVMSHWISNPNIYTIQRDHVNVMESVFGQKGFSRSSVDSIGMNIYTGTKSSPRVIPSPVVPKEKVLISQLWNVRCDVTYSPIANKLFNLLTAQAGGVMAASNSLLDRFYGVVLSRLYPDISSNDMPSHRRYCSLSIFTAGSQKSRCDGFANTPHIDKKDVFEQNFQREARRLLDELRVMFSYEETVLEDLAYLECLSQFETGFCVPTTCGYSFVNQQTEPVSPTSTQNIADFAMIGLGVSVTIRPKCYHFFMASLFTHCTPVPVQIHSSGIMSLYSGSYNLVGWGGGKAANDNTYTQRRYNLRSRSRRRRQQKRRRQN